eukprot:CAMPEP_0196653886 /NCGR_PEP_ID=MMETSP1086-20130531/3556_1 /TAXON_ID=77921 /ORGANISM="Cyanoptyche  gloeocystis , Strain SAG4.97" /LENGTH=61 /DNA_ID=CAMNT_0041985317 /DNA_START=866 /DNA_END=1051 /DNA_ORIENTATION=+
MMSSTSPATARLTQLRDGYTSANVPVLQFISQGELSKMTRVICSGKYARALSAAQTSRRAS